ncbi:GGDEF domain-containing protein [Caldimonas sp. KR1-144]
MDMLAAFASPAQALSAGLAALGAVAYGKDANGRYVWVNAAAEAVFEQPAAQILGRTDAELFAPALAATLKLQDQGLSVVSKGQSLAELTIDRGGQKRDFQTLRMRVDPAASGGAVMMGAWFETTAARRSETQLRAALEQLEEQQRAYETLRNEVEGRGPQREGARLYPVEQFDDHLRREIDLSMREHREFALVLVALDPVPPGTPSHEPNHGRERVIEALGRLLRSNTRAMDAPCRLGPERFAVLLSGVGLATAHARMEGFRRQCATQLVALGGEALRFTVSMGVASFPHTAQTQSGLVKSAEDALSEAHRRGGNHVALASIPFDSH